MVNIVTLLLKPNNNYSYYIVLFTFPYGEYKITHLGENEFKPYECNVSY